LAAVQIGKSFRNEISPRQGVIRLREFTQAEAEIFIDPRDKSHPRFAEVADIKMKFYSQAAQEKGEAEEMTFGEAVKRGIVAHQALAYYVARTYQFLLAVEWPRTSCASASTKQMRWLTMRRTAGTRRSSWTGWAGLR